MPETFDYTFETPKFKGKVSFSTGCFIGGKFVDGADKTTIECVSFSPSFPCGYGVLIQARLSQHREPL
jgi:hypothetical protein